MRQFVQAEWIASLVSGELELPTLAERAAEAKLHRAVSRRFPAAGHAEVSIPLIHDYLDTLVVEVVAARRGRSYRSRQPWYLRLRLVRYLLPLCAADYASLLL